VKRGGREREKEKGEGIHRPRARTPGAVDRTPLSTEILLECFIEIA